MDPSGWGPRFGEGWHGNCPGADAAQFTAPGVSVWSLLDEINPLSAVQLWEKSGLSYKPRCVPAAPPFPSGSSLHCPPTCDRANFKCGAHVSSRP
jgi:hypothetical protein